MSTQAPPSSKAPRDGSRLERTPSSPPAPKTLPEALERALGTAIKSGLTAFGARAALALLLRLPAVVRGKASPLAAIQAALRNVDAQRLGAFMGVFSGAYKAILALLNHYRGHDAQGNASIAGAIAGLAILAEHPDQRVTWGQYAFVRALQCLYNAFDARGWLRFAGGPWKHGDALLFILSSAQVMYAYVLRPESIPSSYYHFIVKTGPIDELVLQNVRKNIRGVPVDVAKLNDYAAAQGGIERLTSAFPKYIPNYLLHPRESRILVNALRVFSDSFGKVLPLYLALNFVPMVVLRLKSIVKRPLGALLSGLLSAGQSTAFLAAFVAMYMFFISAHRRLLDIGFAGMTRDHKLVYWLAGIFSSLSIFIEKKNRRGELAMYALPRGADSLVHILVDHNLFARVKHGEVGLFMIASAIIMHFYETEQTALSPLVKGIIGRFIDT